MYQKLKQKFSRGSILVVSLIMLGLMLVSALSFSLVSIQERKASVGENKSNQAYSTAETGVEIVMQKMKDNSGGNLSDIGCNGGAITSTEGYTVKFKDATDNFITDCGTPIASVKSVKSIGTADQNQRAVEVAVAGEGCETIKKISGSSAVAKNVSVSCDSGCVITNYGKRVDSLGADEALRYAGWLFYYKSSAIGGGQWNDVGSIIGSDTLTLSVPGGFINSYGAVIQCEPSL